MVGVTVNNYSNSIVKIRTFNAGDDFMTTPARTYIMQPGDLDLLVDDFAPTNAPVHLLKVQVDNEDAVTYQTEMHIDLGPVWPFPSLHPTKRFRIMAVQTSNGRHLEMAHVKRVLTIWCFSVRP
jgi:hypothetical protein